MKESRNLKNFFAELQRRHVYKTGVAYAVVTWLLIQIATQVFPFFEVPSWAIRMVVILLVLGFPVALVLAWVFDVTPQGIKATPTSATSTSTSRDLNPDEEVAAVKIRSQPEIALLYRPIVHVILLVRDYERHCRQE